MGCEMSEGWLFRLRSSLGAQHAAPAWPSTRVEHDDGAVCLRRLSGVAESAATPSDAAIEPWPPPAAVTR